MPLTWRFLRPSAEYAVWGSRGRPSSSPAHHRSISRKRALLPFSHRNIKCILCSSRVPHNQDSRVQQLICSKILSPRSYLITISVTACISISEVQFLLLCCCCCCCCCSCCDYCFSCNRNTPCPCCCKSKYFNYGCSSYCYSEKILPFAAVRLKKLTE